MTHETPLISTIVAGLVLAFIFGIIANRLRMPPLIGYLIAGVAVGPFTPGFIANQELALELSEIGVILLMFGVGLNFSLRDLISVQAVAIPGALGRILFGTLMGMGLAYLLGWPLFAGIIFGIALSVASTVVLLKALQDRHLADSERGRIAIGWVIVEDIAMVLALVLIPAFAPLAGGTNLAPDDPFVAFVERLLRMQLGLPGVIAVTLVKLAAFVGFMLIVGRRLIPMVLHYTAHMGSRELFRLAVLAIALGVAAGSAYLFGVSLALGAFFAGMILSESELSHRAAEETLPLRDAFSVLFFVAVGMLFDPSIFVRSPLPVLGVLFIVLIGKTVVAYLLMVLFRRSVATSLTIAASLAQIGEFSFVLAGLGITLGLLPIEGRDLILAAAMISILLNPLMFWAAERLRPALEARFKTLTPELGRAGLRVEPELAVAGGAPVVTAAADEVEMQHPTNLDHHTVLIGYGRVGSVIGEGLLREGRPFVLIEDSEARVQAARAAGIETIVENAATARALKLANAKGADTIIVAIPNAFEAGQATEQSRKLNKQARIIARAHSDEEEAHLRHLGADGVIMGEREIGMGMLDLVHSVPLHPVATNTSIEQALGKALDVRGRRQPLIDPAPVVPPVPAAAPAETNASIEAALGRALDLEQPVAPPVLAEPEIAPVAEAVPVEPQAAAREESWLYEPAVEAVPEEHLHADDLAAEHAAEAAEEKPEPERLRLVSTQDQPVAAPSPELDLWADDADAPPPEVIEPYPDYWGLEKLRSQRPAPTISEPVPSGARNETEAPADAAADAAGLWEPAVVTAADEPEPMPKVPGTPEPSAPPMPVEGPAAPEPAELPSAPATPEVPSTPWPEEVPPSPPATNPFSEPPAPPVAPEIPAPPPTWPEVPVPPQTPEVPVPPAPPAEPAGPAEVPNGPTPVEMPPPSGPPGVPADEPRGDGTPVAGEDDEPPAFPPGAPRMPRPGGGTPG